MAPDSYLLVDSCYLIVVLIVGLWLKFQIELVDKNDSIFTSLPSLLHIFV